MADPTQQPSERASDKLASRNVAMLHKSLTRALPNLPGVGIPAKTMAFMGMRGLWVHRLDPPLRRRMVSMLEQKAGGRSATDVVGQVEEIFAQGIQQRLQVEEAPQTPSSLMMLRHLHRPAGNPDLRQ